MSVTSDHDAHGELPGARAVTIAGERLLLTPGRALVWPARRALIVADVHIGKAATFRALGMPVPRGTTADNLARLSALIELSGSTTLYVLGDLLHSKRALPPPTLATFRAWRRLHADLRIVLIAGNHDVRAGAPPSDLEIEPANELRVGPFVLAHHPRAHDDGYVLSGHLHPAMRVSGRYDTLRLPCYWMRERLGVLPAFGAFTGASEIAPEAADRVFVVTEERVFALP